MSDMECITLRVDALGLLKLFSSLSVKTVVRTRQPCFVYGVYCSPGDEIVDEQPRRKHFFVLLFLPFDTCNNVQRNVHSMCTTTVVILTLYIITD